VERFMSKGSADKKHKSNAATLKISGRHQTRHGGVKAEQKPVPIPGLSQISDAVRRVAATSAVQEPAPLTATAEQLVKEAAEIDDDLEAYALLNAALRKLSMEQRRALPVMIRKTLRFAESEPFMELAEAFESAIKNSDKMLADRIQPQQVA
jgi:hypothetical protein